MNAALALDRVEYTYRRNPALRGVSLQLAPGEVVAVTGASGCGKSTRLHCAAGILTPDVGAVQVDGQDLAELPEDRRAALRRTKIGIVCDRACSFLLAAAFMATYPATIGPLAIYLVQFGVLDTMLTFSFLLWPWLLSPNYFYKVDRPIYLWNWSKPAKALNTAAVVISLVVAGRTGAQWLPYTIAIAALVVKIVSSYRLILIICGRRAAVPEEGL